MRHPNWEEYPKTNEITDESAVMCPCRLKAMDLPASGRRKALCSLLGPRDDGYLNGTHPALLAFVRSNCDVQLPYRLPYACAVCAGLLEPSRVRVVIAIARNARRMPKRATAATTVPKRSQWRLGNDVSCRKDTNEWLPRHKHVVWNTRASDT